MKEKQKHLEMHLPILVLSFIPLLMVAMVYHKLPEMVPVQWTNGGIRYGEKWQLFLVSGISILLGAGMPLLGRIDPRKKNYEKFQDTYTGIQIIVLFFMAFMMFFSIWESLYPDTLPINKVIYGSIAVLFILVGNLMPKIKSNFFMGMKTPWTLSNEAVWNKTHRLSGKLFVAGGILIFLCTFLLRDRFLFWSCIGIVLSIILILILMSYIWYRQEVQE